MKGVAATLSLCALLLAGALAQEPSPEELEALRRKIEAQTRERERLADEAERRRREVEALTERLVAAAAALQNQETAVRAVEARLALLTADIAASDARLTTLKTDYADVLGALQALEMSRPPAIAMHPDDAATAARIGMLLADAAPRIEARARTIKSALDELRAMQAEADAERRDLAEANVELAKRRDALETLVAEKRAERDEAARLAGEAQREISRLAARASSLSDLVDRLERFRRAVAPRLKPDAPDAGVLEAPAPSSKPRRGRPLVADYAPPSRFVDARGALPSPVSGAVAARFGEMRAGGGRQEGVVFQTSAGALVTAPFAGKVVFAREWRPLGNVLILDVGGGYHLVLVGFDRFVVSEGETVSAGEPLGGMTGAAPAPELYLEIRRNSEPVDPSPWLAAARTDGGAG